MSSWDPLICAHIVSPSSFLLTHYTSINSRQGMIKKKKRMSSIVYLKKQQLTSQLLVRMQRSHICHLYSAGQNTKWHSHLGKQLGQFLSKISIYLPYKVTVTFLCIHPREMKTYVCTKTCSWMVTAALFVIAKYWEKILSVKG